MFSRMAPVAFIAAVTLTGLALAVPTGAATASVVRPAATTVHRVLFDDTLAEEAGNADWIISTSKPDPLAQNANPTTETSWTGALSAWGVALQKTGQYSLKTQSTGTITYGGTGTLDLKNFDELVVPEPNIKLTAAEKTAIMTFVKNGGGLFLIVDHNGSDRNNDGCDSVCVANDLMTNNTVDSTDPFGISEDINDISTNNPTAITDATNPVLHGSFGTVTGSIVRDGSTQTLHPADNANAKGLTYLTTATKGGTTGASFSTSTFGSGRFAIWGDSSPIDDGTGQSGNTLYDGWDDPAGTDAALALNATAWLAGTGGTGGTGLSVNSPGNQSTQVSHAVSVTVTASGGTSPYTWTATGLPTGLSISSGGVISGTPSATGTFNVVVTAHDAASATASASFTWVISTTGGSCTATQLLGNPGFETGTAAPWTASTNVIAHSTKEPARTGTYDAWLDGYGTATNDTLSQSVTIPAGCRTASFSYYLHIDTAETTTTKKYDTLTVSAGGTTLATYSNLNKVTGYALHTSSLNAFIGQTVTITFNGVEDAQDQTSFVVDDTSLTVS